MILACIRNRLLPAFSFTPGDEAGLECAGGLQASMGEAGPPEYPLWRPPGPRQATSVTPLTSPQHQNIVEATDGSLGIIAHRVCTNARPAWLFWRVSFSRLSPSTPRAWPLRRTILPRSPPPKRPRRRPTPRSRPTRRPHPTLRPPPRRWLLHRPSWRPQPTPIPRPPPRPRPRPPLSLLQPRLPPPTLASLF
jgi:hypothetical protein